MILVMFDIDGTLTESFALDAIMFLDAVRKTFGFREISDDWALYRHVTGAGVMREIVETKLGRPPTQEEDRKVQARLEASLRVEIEAAGGIRPIPGAADVIRRLNEQPDDYGIAVASGNWAQIAHLMLGSAGLPIDGIPAAFSDDEVTREGICRTAHQRARKRYHHPFPRVVYIGDGVWDVRTSQALGYGFVGIGRDAAAERLRAAGAAEVRPDFADGDAFLAAVERAAATLPPASSQSGETAGSAD